MRLRSEEAVDESLVEALSIVEVKGKGRHVGRDVGTGICRANLDIEHSWQYKMK